MSLGPEAVVALNLTQHSIHPDQVMAVMAIDNQAVKLMLMNQLS
jgi:hypothetical protein